MLALNYPPAEAEWISMHHFIVSLFVMHAWHRVGTVLYLEAKGVKRKLDTNFIENRALLEQTSIFGCSQVKRDYSH